jgi:hypothetical protein
MEEDREPPPHEAVAGDGRIQPNKNREMQVARTGGRKLFDAARKAVFLEWFAATANVVLSAEQAGINYKTAFRHRMQDERFRELWDLALEQGVARQKAKLIETKCREPRIGIEGDLDAPEMEEPDPQIVLAILRESERRLAGYPKRGGMPKIATNEEVREALVKRLAVFGVRVSSGDRSPAGEGEDRQSGPSPLDGSLGPDGPRQS